MEKDFLRSRCVGLRNKKCYIKKVIIFIMKDYKKILQLNKTSKLVEHQWGESAITIYNQVVNFWNCISMGEKIFIKTRKTLGLPGIVKLLKLNNLSYIIVGKGVPDIRLIEIIKDKNKDLKIIETEKFIDFEFNHKNYHVYIGESVFSKNKLDDGTRFLLEVAINEIKNFENKTIGDLGSGWGAISIILAREFPPLQINAFEYEIAAYEACQRNAIEYKNIEVLRTSLTIKNNPDLNQWKGKLDYITANFPFHINGEERDNLFENAKTLLKRKGELYFITGGRFSSIFEKTASKFFNLENSWIQQRYKVFKYISK